MSNTRNVRSTRNTAQARAAAAAASRRDARDQRPADRLPEPEPLDDAEDNDTEDRDESPSAQEVETQGYVGASLDGHLIRIVPPSMWRQSWQRMLRQGLNDEFAELAIHPDDLDQFFEIDPTNDEISQFINDAGELAGEGLGKSRGPNRSSRRTRNR